MLINPKILSIPPYISTSWKNIASLHVESRENQLILIISMVQGKEIEIPHLDQKILEMIFIAHAQFLQQSKMTPNQDQFAFPLSIGGEEFENMNPMLLQHNPEQAYGPDLPPVLLNKIADVSKVVGIDDPNLLPRPEPHCNCMHCQIVRAIQEGVLSQTESEEEIVTDEDLKFRLWDIQQTAEKMYLVSDPIEANEHYNVFLGDPIGCTCGEKNCVHIKAVLNS